MDRLTNRSYDVNLPVPLAEAIEALKGETSERSIEDRNTLVLRRHEHRKLLVLKP